MRARRTEIEATEIAPGWDAIARETRGRAGRMLLQRLQVLFWVTPQALLGCDLHGEHSQHRLTNHERL